MIRGAIEVVEDTHVGGWIFSAVSPVRGETVLAFIGPRCVGAGHVEIFRQDLLDAGLGDGYCGFDFAIRLTEGERLGALLIRLQFSDLALLQPASRISGPQDDLPAPETAVARADLGAMAPRHVTWLTQRGLLDQNRGDFLGAIQSVGAHEHSLRPPKRADGTEAPRAEPDSVVRDLLGLFLLAEVRVVGFAVASISDLATQVDLVRRSPCAVLALWSRDRCRISVEERSHLEGPRADLALSSTAPRGGIDYGFGPDRLLFLHRDCRFAPRGPAPANGLRLLAATALEKEKPLRLATTASGFRAA